MKYNSENLICKNCNKEFIIESDDFGFYEKINVPPPTFCPDCRALIKVFKDKKAFENYLRFCHSRKREVLQDVIDGHFLVSFKNYERLH